MSRGAWSQPAAAGCSILLIVLQPVIFFWRVLINPSAHIPFDLEGFHLPLIAYLAQCLRRGIAPLWDPYPYCGVPIHADLQAQVFYPFTWLAILAGNQTQGRNLFYWVQCLVPLHMILAGLFVYVLLRRMQLGRPAAVLGASVFQLGGFFASQAQHLGAVCSAPWLPLAILAVFELRHRVRLRWIAILAIAIAMSILAGFAGTALVVAGAVLLVMVALLVVREASWRVVPAVAAGFLAAAVIAAVQLVPLWQLSHSSVAAMRANWYTTGGGLTLHSLVSLVFPNYYHIFELGESYKLPYNFTFLYVYCGIATVILIALAPFIGRSRARMFLALTIVSAFWMLGEHTPVYRSVFVRLPSLLRGALYSEFALLAFCCFAAITGAIVLDRIGRRAPQAVLWSIVLYTSYDLIQTGSNRPMNSYAGGYETADSEYAPAGAVKLSEKLRSLVNQTVPPSRIDYTDSVFAQGIRGSDMLGLPTANGDSPFLLRRMLYLRRLFTAGQPWERQLSVNRLDSPLLSMLNVAWIVGRSPIPPDQISRAGLEPVDLVDGYHVYHNPRALPRFFLVPRIRSSPGEAETFRVLAQDGFRPAEEAVVEGLPEGRAGLATAGVRVNLYSPNRIELAVTSAAPAFLVTSEPMYTGWTARVNGKPRNLVMTNGAFRGLFLPSGSSRIVMEYHPPYFALWLLLSAIAFLGTLAAAAGTEGLKQLARLPQTIATPLTSPARVEWLRFAWRKSQLFWDSEIVPRRSTIRSLLLLLLATVLFYWKIVLTGQFSLLTESEGVSQAYSWLQFWTSTLRYGFLPLWDPYTLAGHPFAGEMQTAAFYPLHLLLALFPPGSSGFSPHLYHLWFVFTHFLGACFMYALVRELGLRRLAACIAGICFSLGGFVARMPWPHMLESSIWLPLVFLFFLRAIRADESRRAVWNSAIAGLVLGLSILAGGLHVVIMQVLAIMSAAGYHGFTGDLQEPGIGLPAAQQLPWFRRPSWVRAGSVAATIIIVALAAGAVQLLPSIEYSSRSIRFLGKAGALPANQKIPYADLADGLWPNSFVAMLIPQAFNGNLGAGEVANPYLGVFPLLLAIIGIWRNWSNRWVRYLAGLAAAAFLYSLGSLSPLHGVLYAVIPRLWMAREAGRMVYLADFSFAIMAAFGLETLLSSPSCAVASTTLNRILAAIAIASAAGLFVPAVFARPEISPWIALSLLMILLSYGLFRYVAQGHTGAPARALMVALIVFDLSAFDWSARNKLEVSRNGVNHLDRLLGCRGAVQFLKSRPGPFRVEVGTDPKPNIGDFFGIETTNSAGVTLPVDFAKLAGKGDLLNVRYRLAPSSSQEPGAVYRDSFWKVYQNPGALPRAWVVHETAVEPSAERALARLENSGFDPWRTAVIDRPASLEPRVEGAYENATFSVVERNRLELSVHAQGRGMLVLSEMFYPGWRATVNSSTAGIYRADVGLRGIIVPSGDSRITLEYTPWSIYLGGFVTLAAFLGILAARLRRASGRYTHR
jgi:Bacterial membrane protein YfhO